MNCRGQDHDPCKVIARACLVAASVWPAKKGTVGLCSTLDGPKGLSRRMVASDLMLFAARIFCWGFWGPMSKIAAGLGMMVGGPGGSNRTGLG